MHGPDATMINGYSRSTTVPQTSVTSMHLSARRAGRTSTDLPRWSCGFDSQRPPRPFPAGHAHDSLTARQFHRLAEKDIWCAPGNLEAFACRIRLCYQPDLLIVVAFFEL